MPTPLPNHAPSPPRHSRPRPGRVVAALTVLVMTLLVGGVLRAGADPTVTAPPPDPAVCRELASRYASQLPTGWSLECRETLPQGWPGGGTVSAISNRRERRIVVLDGQRADYTEASIAHELAHAESSAWPAELKVEFARAVGATAWTGEGGPASPAEVFAESAVRCRGLGTHASYPLVPCELVEAARTAGGSSEPLPVSGPHPRA